MPSFSSLGRRVIGGRSQWDLAILGVVLGKRAYFSVSKEGRRA